MVEKKKFLPIEIPLLNTEKEVLGTTIASLNNRTIKIDLTRTLRGKSVEVIFNVTAEKEKAIAKPKKLALMGFFIRRMIRKGTNYIEDSFSSDCNDKILRIKPFLITRKKVSRRIRKSLRETSKNYIKNYIKNRSSEEIFRDIISSKLQKSLSLKMKKIYPLSLCEIRVLEVEKEKSPEEIAKGAEKTEEEIKKAKEEAEKEQKTEKTEKEKPAEKVSEIREETKKTETKQEDKIEEKPEKEFTEEKPKKEKPEKTKKTRKKKEGKEEKAQP